MKNILNGNQKSGNEKKRELAFHLNLRVRQKEMWTAEYPESNVILLNIVYYLHCVTSQWLDVQNVFVLIVLGYL